MKPSFKDFKLAMCETSRNRKRPAWLDFLYILIATSLCVCFIETMIVIAFWPVRDAMRERAAQCEHANGHFHCTHGMCHCHEGTK